MRKTLSKRKSSRDAPPKIIYLVGLLAYAAWGGWAYLLFNFSPEESLNRTFFLAVLFAAVFFTFLFLFYQGGKVTSGRSSEVVFYPAVRRAFFLAIFVLSLAGMRLLEIFTWINAGLLGTILLLTEFQLSRRGPPHREGAEVDRKGYHR